MTFQLSEEGQSESGLAKKQEEILGSRKEEETGHWTQRVGELGGMQRKLRGEFEEAEGPKRPECYSKEFFRNPGALEARKHVTT